MFDFEGLSEPLEEMEHNNDVVFHTPVRGFERISDFDGSEVLDYLRDYIPDEHLKGCREIRYNPENIVFVGNDNILGIYNMETRSIEIASQRSFETLDDMLDTVVHEVGHNTYTNLELSNPQAAMHWQEMYYNSFSDPNGLGFVSDYAKTNLYEDFAESYKTYIRDPELLQFMNPGKYEFLKYNVFSGREFGSIMTDSGHFYTVDKSVADVLDKVYECEEGDNEGEIVISDSSSPVADTYRCFSMIA